MHLGLRLLFGFFLIAGLATVFVLRVFLGEVKPSVREVMEDILVDSANLLAEQALPDLRAMPAGGSLQGSRFAAGVSAYLARPVDAQIWGLHKRSLDLRVYVTDAGGRIVFDQGDSSAPAGADYSRWRDVARTLRGEYGARTTRDVVSDERSAVLYVAAPVRDGPRGPLLGVLTVAKPVASVQPFIDRAEHKIFVAGAWLLGLSLAVGVAVTLWTVHSVRRLRRYALQARSGGPHPPVPRLPGELGELAQAMGAMRERLDHHAELEREVRALTHELKSPLTAIGGAAELLHDELPAADRERFAQQIGSQVQRMRELVDRALDLARLERLQAPQQRQPVDLAALVQQQLDALAPLLAQRGLQVHSSTPGGGAVVQGDPQALALATSNLLHNAIDFAPAGSSLDWTVQAAGGELVFTLRDHGPGVPDFAWPRLGERWFSTPRPRDGAKGSGMGLAIARQVAALHGGSLQFQPMQPGLQVRLVLPAAPSAR